MPRRLTTVTVGTGTSRPGRCYLPSSGDPRRGRHPGAGGGRRRSPSSASTCSSRSRAAASSGCARSTRRRPPSFSVNAELGLWNCFGCDKSGDVITFVREIEHLDFAARRRVAGRPGRHQLRYTQQGEGEGRKERQRLVEAMEKAVDWYHDRLLHLARRRPGPRLPARARASTASRCAATGSAGRPTTGTRWPAASACPRRC